MNPQFFYLGALVLMALWAAILVFPLVRKKKSSDPAVNNVQIIKQRLQELSREQQEGLISLDDKSQMEIELKRALLDEVNHADVKKKGSSLVTIAGFLLAAIVGSVSYFYSHQLKEVKQIQHALEQLPALSAKLQKSDPVEINAQDINDLSLAIRQRLQQEPEDIQGWLFLTRLHMALGQEVQAVAAIEKAWRLDPNSENVRSAYIQTLMATADETQLLKAERILKIALAESPDNDNYMLMMAVVSAQLSRGEQASLYFDKVKEKLDPEAEIYKSLTQRIRRLTTPVENDTGFVIRVQLAEALQNVLPENGFLIVFAQDALSSNRMPAAVIKLPLTDFPVTVRLGSDQAMLETYSLSQLKKVTLVARVSADEDVSAAMGELQGEQVVEVSSGAMTPVTLVISRILSE